MAILARINHIRKFFNKEETVSISDYLDEKQILFLNVNDRDSALEQLVQALDEQKKLCDKEAFHQAVLEREKIISTGIGMGVAIPHAKLEGYDDFFIAIGIQYPQGIEWNALDGSPVHLIFMIGGPEDKQTKYLKILSRLTTVIKDQERRKKVIKSTSARQVIELFRGW